MKSQRLAAVSISVLVAAEVPNFYAGLLPSEMTIKRFAAEDEDRKTLRSSMMVASVEAGFFIAASAYAAQSFLPVVLGGTMMAITIWRYATSIDNPHPNAKPINDQPETNAAPIHRMM